MWRKKDFKEIVDSDRMFARKFDEKIDMEIINLVEEHVRDRKKEM